MLHRRWDGAKNTGGWSKRESTLKENSLPEIYSYTILAFSADKRSYCIPLMYHRMKNPPMECNSDRFEQAREKNFRIEVPEGEINKILRTQMVAKDCTIHMSNVKKCRLT